MTTIIDALQRYGRHRNDSEHMCAILRHSGNACDCGFDAALAAAREQQPVAWGDVKTRPDGKRYCRAVASTDQSNLGYLPLYAAPPAPDAEDAARLDWLERQCVTVDKPLRHGSRQLFFARPDDDEETSDIRQRIDAARLGERKHG